MKIPVLEYDLTTKFIASALLLAMVMQVPYATPIFISLFIGFAIIYYCIALMVMCGMIKVDIGYEIPVRNRIINIVFQIVSVITVFGMSTFDVSYGYVAMFALPWVVLNVATNIVGFLVQNKIIKIEK